MHFQVLVIYTGGTIGMTRNHEGALSPEPHAMEKVIRNTITMHDENYSQMRFGHQTKLAFAQDEAPREDAELADLLPLVLPHIPDLKRVVYQIYEYDPLLDSSNMTMDDWIHIAKPLKHTIRSMMDLSSCMELILWLTLHLHSLLCLKIWANRSL